ncbi:type II secretion system protein [Marinomonas ostreistagni]|uniref:type II secretion system protein n=1 Tax=Marinomonas ostreistagni TaxID=359209 RepID=UPI00194FD042|nr:type II secretion system protein [Marinomonas ostreistagni]MBM6549674.1 type II secretion system protein [Marinomonas ostreistagni]
MVRPHSRRGFMLLEAVLAIAILVTVVALVSPFIGSVQQATHEREAILQRLALERVISEQLRAQFARLGRVGCHNASGQMTIGSSASPPAILRQADLVTGSDWLRATDSGLCNGYGIKQGQRIEAQLPCDGLDIGDHLLISSCTGAAQARVLTRQAEQVIAQTDASALLDGTVLLSTQVPFYWYLAPGRAHGVTTLWRKPVNQGNATELQPNITHLRVYPVVDSDQDGHADTIETRLKQVALNSLEGMLVEYRFQVSECVDALSNHAKFTYHSLRGDTWRYDNRCSAVSKILIDLGRW